MNWNLLTAMVYNLCLLAGTTYVVVTYNWSMWSYLIPFCAIATYETKRKIEDEPKPD